MDPVTIASLLSSASGMAMSLFGSSQSTKYAKEQAAAQANIAGLEQQQDAVRRQGMELDAQRKSMEVLRNSQRARAMAQSAATNQGASFGSGLQGGYGQISGQAGINLLGINQSRELGENMFDLNAKIDQQKINYANAGGQLAGAQAMSGLGKSLVSDAGTIGNIFGSMGGIYNNMFGSNQGYGGKGGM